MNPADALADESVRKLADEILARPEYARFRPPGRDFGQIFHWFDGLLDWIRSLYDDSPLLWWALFLGLIAVGLALLAHIVWSIRAALRSAGAPAPRRPEPPEAFDLQAERLAASGHLLEAAHAMHLACIDRLLHHRLLELRRHDPNRTLRSRVGAAALPADLRAEFMRLLDELEVRWFRDRAASPARDERLFADWRALHARLAASGSGA